ncbi:MAG: 2-dehydropantoate 2-reductase [Chloroflexi bacterium]|nr:MAG: 2-dehydropantoate 2-reductase [Chloroflexota bacterium]TMG70944.1 MAG: 2-dehydropantoate 2-reductase [Chloroflexota bacterium]
MRIAILGMGAIGHVMARALEGHPKVDLVRIDRTAAPLRADEPPVDVAIVATKTPGTEWAANVAGKLLANDGVALTIQNGLGNYETLAEHVGHERAAVGVIYVGAQLVDGELRATGPGTLELGRPSGEKPRANLEELAMLLAEGGMEVRLVDDPWPSVWRKLVTNAAVNPLTALVGKTNADLLTDPAAASVADALAREVARVARAYGVPISEQEAVTQWRSMAALTGANRSSMLQDVDAGRATEVDAISGAVAREGERRGVAAPLNQAMTILVSALQRD